jgi:hypothetical protein
MISARCGGVALFLLYDRCEIAYHSAEPKIEGNIGQVDINGEGDKGGNLIYIIQ